MLFQPNTDQYLFYFIDSEIFSDSHLFVLEILHCKYTCIFLCDNITIKMFSKVAAVLFLVAVITMANELTIQQKWETFKV